MTIYILLLVFVLLCPSIYQGLGYFGETRERKVLHAAFFVIFIICALKSPEVGRDISAYKLGYEMTQNAALNDFSFIYYEAGFLFLMKLCIFLHLPFQAFMVLVYVIITIPIMVFIEKYSDDSWLSTVIYICYMYFEFNMTGIRQAIASSICFIAFSVLLEKKRFCYIKYFALVTLAVTMHSAAFIGYFVVLALIIPSLQTYTILLTAGSIGVVFLRGSMLAFIKALAGKASMNASANMHIGGNFIFVVVLGLLFVYVFERDQLNEKSIVANYYSTTDEIESIKRVNNNALLARIYLLSIPFLLLFGSDNSVRSSMLLSQVLMVLLPNSLTAFSISSQKMVRIGLLGFLIVFFITNTLIPNNFDIVPYQFFWQ